MAEEEQDEASKTEEPSHKRLEDARKKGQTVQSREIGHFFMLLALTFLVLLLFPAMGRDVTALLSPYVTRPEQLQINAGTLGETLSDTLSGLLVIMILPVIVAFVGAFAAPTIQNKWIFSTEQMKPKFDKISPMKGLERIFSRKALLEFIKSLLKVSLIGVIVYLYARPYFSDLGSLVDDTTLQILDLSQHIAGKILIGVCIAMFLISGLDYFLQHRMFMKSMRMTRQELKEEYKQQEGDPLIRAKLKQIRRDKARRRMMANVPKADVIITNPTHYAVALQYDAATMAAPKVVAKGTDDVAARIRELAEKHKIPILRNPPLARVLYDTTDVDADIPFEHYQAVAKIIGYVYRMQGKMPKDLKKPATKKQGPTTLYKRKGP